MKTTENYGLKKPEENDFYNVNDANDNMDVIDAKLKEFEDCAKGTTTHPSDTNNPHKVTAAQVGLGNVPNVSTNNQTPTYTVTSANAELKSGEKLSVAFGKIAKAVSSLISHIANVANPHSVTKSQVGLGSVDNTSDKNKPVSTAQQAALDLKVNNADYEVKIAALEKADTLNSQYTGNVSMYAQQVADDLNNHKNSKANPHNVTKRHVGLENVDNTSDINKPISTATQAALDLKAERTEVIVDNLTPFPYLEMVKTQSDVVWNIDNKGIVKGTGVASADSGIYISKNFTLPAGTYTLSGCPKDGGANTYRLQLATSDYVHNYNDFGDGVTFTLTEETTFAYFRILAKGGVTVTNLTFKPMLEEGAVAHPYQPYNLSRKGITEQMIVENLIQYPHYHTTKVTNGITFTDLEDGTVKVNGTATAFADYSCRSRGETVKPLVLPAGTYTLSGCPKGGDASTYRIHIGKSNDKGEWVLIGNDTGNGFTFTLTEETQVGVSCAVSNGATVPNLVFKPMLEKGSIAHPYTEYRKSHTKLREDLDTLMEDTGWITLKENGTYTAEGYGTQYTVVHPIQYRVVGKQLFVCGDISISFSSSEEEYAYVYIYLPDGFEISSTTPHRLVNFDVNTDGTVGNTLTISLSESSIYFNARRGVDGGWSIRASFYESVLLD